MPIFDNEILNAPLNRENNIPTSTIESPTTGTIVRKGLGGFGEQPVENTGMSLDELNKFSNVPNSTSWDGPVQMIPQGELLANKRYGNYERGLDLEEYHAYAQPWYNQIYNGLVKMGATAAGTFAQGFATIPNTIAAIKHGDIKELSNPEGYENSIDTWLKNIEDRFPNFMTRHEQEHPFISAIPGFAGSANFWGNMVLKNLGFTVGAIGSALVQDAAVGALTEGIGDVPLIASQVGKASLWLNKIFAGTQDVEKIANLASKLGINEIRGLAASTKITDGIRYGVNLYGASRTEAAMEARDGYRQVKDELVKQYKNEHLGEDPSGETLAEFDKYATDAMNVRFGINMALLSVSNAIQFDNLFKSFGKASVSGSVIKNIEEAGKIGLKEGSLDVFEKKIPSTIQGKVWDAIKPKLPLIFSEGVYEEGGQYAAERGTYDYYTRKYKDPNKGNNRQSWDDLNETIKSTLYGFQQEFGTDEGLQNIFVGAISALITGGVQHKIDNYRGVGANARIQTSLNTLNQYGLTGTLNQKYENTLNSIGILGEMKEAITSGDVYKYKNLQADNFFNFVTSRIPSGMHDVTIEQLEMLKDLSKEEFEKTFGTDFNETNRNTVVGYVDNLINKANEIKSTVDILDNTFKNPFKNITDAQTDEERVEKQKHDVFNSWKTDLAYYATVPSNVNERLSSIGNDIIKIHPLLNTELIGRLTSREGLKDLAKIYNEKATQLEKTITEYTSPQDKRKTIRDVKALKTLAERIGLMPQDKINLKTFNDLLNFELNNQDFTKEPIVSPAHSAKLIEYGVDVNKLSSLKTRVRDIFDRLSSEEGFNKYFEQANEIASENIPEALKENEFVNSKKEKETPIIGKEYELPNVKKAYVQGVDNVWKLFLPNKQVEEYKDKEDALANLAEANKDINDLARVKLLAINNDGTFKVEDLGGNISNISPDSLYGYSRVETPEEKMSKDSSQLEKSQNNIINNSGTVPTGDPSVETLIPEGKLKSANKFFISTTQESEDLHDPTQSSPHVKRSRVFLNNAKTFKNRKNLKVLLVTANNEANLGLSGLINVAYNSNVPEDVNNINTGFVGAVFVEHVKGKTYFVDEQGKHINEVGNTTDINKVIFQTMPTTEINYNFTDKKTGLPVPRYRRTEREEFIANSKKWEKKREDILNSGDNVLYDFNISRGIPNIDVVEGKPISRRVGNILIDEDLISKRQNLIEIPKFDGIISHNGENITFPAGRPILHYEDTLQPLLNTKFGTEKATSIYKVITALSEDLIARSKNNQPVIFDSKNNKYVEFLQNVLFYSTDSKLKASNKFLINTKTMSVEIGDKSFPISEIKNREEEIVTQLKDVYHAINDKTLNKDKFNSPFFEFVWNNNTLEEKQWKNYQSCLLSSKNPNGTIRSVEETPLITTVAPKGILGYSYKQKYITLSELELPSIKTEQKKEEVIPEKETPKLGEYILDGKTENIFGKNNIPFTAKYDEQGNIVVEASVSEEVLKNTGKTADEISKIITANLVKLQNKQKVDWTSLINKAVNEKELDAIIDQMDKAGEKVDFDLINKKREELKPKGYDVNDTEAPADNYRRIGQKDEQMMSEEEINFFKEWTSKNVPNIPYEILDNIIQTHDGKLVWGVFENNVAKFYKGGLRGTEYHEIGEAVWNGFLSKNEQQDLINEFKLRKGEFIDRESNKKIAFSDATDKQAKERILDDFADFRLGKLPAKTLGERVKQFFKNIIEFFKSFIRKSSLKDELFEAINTGKFKEYKLGEITSPEYRGINGIPETLAYEYVQDMTARTSQYIFGEEKEAIYDIKKITGIEIYNYLKDLYSGQENKYQVIERAGEGNFDLLWKRTKENLLTMGIRFNEEDKIDINEGDYSAKLYAPEPFSTDWKKTSAYSMKFACSTLLSTEGTWDKGDTLPKRKISEAKGYILNSFNKVFVTLMDKLSNTTNNKKIEEKLFDLAKQDSNFVRFFKNVGGDLNTGEFRFDNFKYADWRFFIDFFQTFTKQHPEAIIQYTSGTEVWNAPANQFTSAKEVQNSWTENMKVLSKKKNSGIVYNSSTKTYKINKIAFTQNTPKDIKEQLSLLGKLGIDFPIDAYFRLSDEEKNSFSKAVGSIHIYLQKVQDIGNIKGKTLGINGPMNTLSRLLVTATSPDKENTYIGVDGEKHQSYTENNVASIFENEFNESDTLDDIIQKRPELNDVFSTHSIILKKGGEFIDEDGNRFKLLKVSYIQGAKDNDTNEGNKTSKIGLGSRFVQEINQNLDGNYNILIPADSATEWMMNFGNHISFKDFQSGRAWNNIYNVFNGYLVDDINLALDWRNREELINVGNKGKELRFFKDILSSNDLDNINSMIDNEVSLEEFNKYIEEHKESINDSIKKYITDVTEETKTNLIENKEVTFTNDEKVLFPNLQDKFILENSLNKFELTTEQFDNLILFRNTNYIINGIESHKLLFGDPYQFEIKNNRLDETKRIKLFLSPRKTTYDTPEYNNFLNENYNLVNNIELTENDLGYHEHKSYTRTATLHDVNIYTDLYHKTNEADAFSILMDTTYREIKFKNSKWADENEKWHQWQMSYTRLALEKKKEYVYSNDKLKEHDQELIKTEEPQFHTEVLKPIVSGIDNNSNNIKLVVDKFAQMPLYYKAVEGKTLEKLYIKMWKEGIGYVIFQSGRKVGAEKLNRVYKPDGTFNISPFTNTIDVPWKAYGIQVETSHEEESDQTIGSQLRKMVSMDLFANGEPFTNSPERALVIRGAYERNKKALDDYHDFAYRSLLNKLGIEDLGQSYSLTDSKAISETLEYEMLRRELSENAKDTIQLDENGQFLIPFEASPYYKQIKNILYSMINKSIITPKVNGRMLVQVPATMWEDEKKGRNLVLKQTVDNKISYKKFSREEFNSLSEEEKKNVYLTSEDLKFYTKDKPYCEVMLPHWFRQQLGNNFKTDDELLNYLNNTTEGQSILTGIGFRIPTQALSSVEVFKVKGFLPQSMGETIVVPSEITTKAGSDFDIDKINTYLKSIYIDGNGDIKLVKLLSTEEETKSFFKNLYEEKTRKELEDVVNTHEFRQQLFNILDKFENITDTKSILDMFPDLTDEETEFYNNHKTVFNNIRQQAEEEDLLPSEYMQNQITSQIEKSDKLFLKLINEKFANDYANTMYKKALENEYFDSLEKLLTLPENYERLIHPVDDAGLKKDSDKLDELRGHDENKIKNRILNPTYITKLRHAFLSGKKWIGIAAVNITGQSLTQKSKVVIDPEKFKNLKTFDRTFLGDGTVVLPHNEIDGKISISGVKTADDTEFISDRLSGYATSFVDVAKDPYILKIIQSDKAVGVFMFLERIGCGKNTIWFMNQPIISEYLAYLENSDSPSLYNKKNLEYIKGKFSIGKTDIDSININVDQLQETIQKYQTGLSETENAIQHKILTEFLKYSKMANFSFKLSQALNYDTTRFKDSDSFELKNTRTGIAEQKNIFSSPNDILSSNFIGKQREALNNLMDAYGSIFKLEQEEFKAITKSVMRKYEEREYISQDDFDKIASKVKAAFLDYIVQRDVKVKEISDIAVQQLEVAKQKYPGMKLLNDLQVVSSDREEGASTIKLKVNTRDAQDENLYVEMMRELKQIEPELYNSLINIALIQGTYQTPVSIKNIIPIEDYANRVSPIINTLKNTPDISNFSNGIFERNNWKDEAIISTFKPKFFSNDDSIVGEDQFGNLIYQYTSPQFSNVGEIKASDRKVLFLNPKYNSMQLENDFLKVPRIVKLSEGELVDMKTGKTVPSRTLAIKRAKGDMSINQYYGYQKVKYSNGEPLITNDGRYVYKLINLWGDGVLASEYYTTPQPSAFDNGTVKINNEILDADLINYFAPKVEQKTVEQQAIEEKQLSLPEQKGAPEGLPEINRPNKKCKG